MYACPIRPRLSIAAITSIALVSSATRQAFAQAAHYDVFPLTLPTEGARMVPHDINERGLIAGEAYGRKPTGRPILWQDGRVRVIGPTDGLAIALNDQASVVGTRPVFGSSSPHASLWTPRGGLEDLTLQAEQGGGANSINERGVIAGYTQYVSDDESAAWATLWFPNGLRHQIARQGAYTTEARDINTRNHAIVAITEPGPVGVGIRSYLWSLGAGLTDLGSLSGDEAAPLVLANAINDADEIVGRSALASGVSRAFYWSASTAMIDLGGLDPARDSEAWDINASGVIVGFATMDARGRTRAVAWNAQDRAIVDLNDRIDSASGWILHIAEGINDQGWIVGSGAIDGRDEGFLLVPAP